MAFPDVTTAKTRNPGTGESNFASKAAEHRDLPPPRPPLAPPRPPRAAAPLPPLPPRSKPIVTSCCSGNRVLDRSQTNYPALDEKSCARSPSRHNGFRMRATWSRCSRKLETKLDAKFPKRRKKKRGRFGSGPLSAGNFSGDLSGQFWLHPGLFRALTGCSGSSFAIELRLLAVHPCHLRTLPFASGQKSPAHRPINRCPQSPNRENRFWRQNFEPSSLVNSNSVDSVVASTSSQDGQ